MTLVETSVSVGVLGILGIVFFQVLQSGLVLSAKNTAVNAAHEEARQGVNRLTRDIHASISVPQLRTPVAAAATDPAGTQYYILLNGSYVPAPAGTTQPRWKLDPINSAPVAGVSPTSAGVSFQNVAAGPNYVFNDPNGTNGLVMIADGPTGQPSPGMRLIIPAWGIEDDIKTVSGAVTAKHSNVFTVSNFETSVKRAPTFAGSLYAIAYYTDRVMYLVQNGRFVADTAGDHNLSPTGEYVKVAPGAGQFRYEDGELHYYRQRSTSKNSSVAGSLIWEDVGVVARHISSPQPFSVPLNTKGGPDNKYIKVQLSARDPKSTNRGYRATATLLDTAIDYRSRITTFQ